MAMSSLFGLNKNKDKTLKDFCREEKTNKGFKCDFPIKLRKEAARQYEIKKCLAVNHPELKEFLMGEMSFIQTFFNLNVSDALCVEDVA